MTQLVVGIVTEEEQNLCVSEIQCHVLTEMNMCSGMLLILPKPLIGFLLASSTTPLHGYKSSIHAQLPMHASPSLSSNNALPSYFNQTKFFLLLAYYKQLSYLK